MGTPETSAPHPDDDRAPEAGPPVTLSTGTDPRARTTRFSDVCGTVDEIKRLLFEEPATVASRPELLESLVQDALLMQARMAARLGEYEQLRAQVIAIAASLREIATPSREAATGEASRVLSLFRRGRPLAADERAEAVERLEVIRSVAQNLEDTLYRRKALALELGRAYHAVRGDRVWALDEAEARELARLPGEPEWARWLPPSPARERVLRYLAAGRAHLIRVAEEAQEKSEGSPPLVQFEDGGMMPLPLVRWSEEIRAFHPADAPAHPRGRLYRARQLAGPE